jgi:hypothetical protein
VRRYLAYGTLMSRQHPPSLAFLACDSYDAWVGQGVYTRIRQGLAEGGGPDGRDQCRSRSALLTMSPREPPYRAESAAGRCSDDSSSSAPEHR